MKKGIVILLCILLILACVGCSKNGSISCVSCNESFDDAAKFCPNCGLAVGANVDTPKETEPAKCNHQYVCTVTTDATCSQDGIETFACSVAGIVSV